MSVPLNIGIELPGVELLHALGPQIHELAQALDASDAACAVIGAERDDTTSQASPSLTVRGVLLAPHTRRVGLVVAASPQRDHPFNMARRLASLDRFSAGRAGLMALRQHRATALA